MGGGGKGRSKTLLEAPTGTFRNRIKGKLLRKHQLWVSIIRVKRGGIYEMARSRIHKRTHQWPGRLEKRYYNLQHRAMDLEKLRGGGGVQ